MTKELLLAAKGKACKQIVGIKYVVNLIRMKLLLSD